MIGLRADFVHLPGIFVQSYAETSRDGLAFFDERVEQDPRSANFSSWANSGNGEAR